MCRYVYLSWHIESHKFRVPYFTTVKPKAKHNILAGTPLLVKTLTVVYLNTFAYRFATCFHKEFRNPILGGVNTTFAVMKGIQSVQHLRCFYWGCGHNCIKILPINSKVISEERTIKSLFIKYKSSHVA